jgi:hypothetical protein
MEADLQSQIAFHLTGRKPGGSAEALDPVEGLALRPALLARYRDLSSLRYDFPLVLARDAAGADCIRSLSGAMDELLKQAAPPGIDGERVRRHVIRLEREIRARLSRGTHATLSALWDAAAQSLQSRGDAQLADSLARARGALKIDGEVLDCTEAAPARVLAHAWSAVQAEKAGRLRGRIRRLALGLSGILKAEWAGSEAGRSARALKASFGTAHEDAFDFEEMSRVLSRAKRGAGMPEGRRERIRGLLAVFESQRFVAAEPGARGEAPASAYLYKFESCAAAAKAHRERLPKRVELARALEVAELEASGTYREATHDPIFGSYGKNGLDAEDLAAFPDYLVCVKAGDRAETVRLMELLSAGLPVKVLVQTDDLLEEESPPGDGRLAFGLRSKQLADMAIGLNSVYVLQSSASNLLRCRESIIRGMKHPGPALFSVFSGAAGKTDGLPPYLVSAAAMESRLFPAFTYDPGAGPDWASRFRVDDNPQVERDWPSQPFSYEDADHQRIAEDVDFTPVDFVACDARYARHFARVPRAKWNGGMIPVRASLQRPTGGLPDKVPCLLMVDANDTLQKVIVDDELIRETRRCNDLWRSLQELGGVHNSHAERLLARERQAWEEQRKASEQKPRASDARPPEPGPAGPAPAQAPTAAAPAEPEKQVSTDEPYIETPRCTSCDECTRLNNRMFAYDANKQAFIANPNAGTYRELVEAAENCQVSIIHPGKPRNPNEPGLEELMKRAEAFA